MDAKSYIFIQILLITVANGKVQICFNTAPLAVTNSQYVSESEISQLITEAKTEITEVLTAWFNETTFNFTTIPVNLSHPAVTMIGEVTNATVVISDKVLKLFTIDPDGFEVFNLTFRSIFLNGSYDLNGYVGASRLFDIYGKGQLSLELLDFSVAFLVNLNITETALCIPILSRVYVADYWNNFENFMNGDEDLDPLLNGAFQYIIPDAIRIIYREMADYADPYIQKAIDDVLQSNALISFISLLKAISLNNNQV